MQHRDKIVLEKIISEIDVADELIGDDSLTVFLDDEKLKRAISMTIINIGELIKTITDELRQEHPEVPWKAAAGMRDIAAHRYQTLRMEDVYNTATADLPYLKEQLQKILGTESVGDPDIEENDYA